VIDKTKGISCLANPLIFGEPEMMNLGAVNIKIVSILLCIKLTKE